MGQERGAGDAAPIRRDPVEEVVAAGGALVVRLVGELDLYNSEPLRKALAEAVRRGPERIVVDLTEVPFVDSTALGALIEAQRKLESPRALVLAGPTAEVRRTLEVAGLDGLFGVFETPDDALAADF